MKSLHILLRLTRRAFLFLLMVYEAIFTSGSLITLILGGPSRTEMWYRHIFEAPWSGKCIGETCTLTPAPSDLEILGWSRFWTIQLVYLTIALLLGWFEWRYWKERRKQDG